MKSASSKAAKLAISQNIQKGRLEISKLAQSMARDTVIVHGTSTTSSTNSVTASYQKLKKFSSEPKLFLMHNNSLLTRLVSGQCDYMEYLKERNERNEIEWTNEEPQMDVSGSEDASKSAHDNNEVDIDGNNRVSSSSATRDPLSWKDVILHKKTLVHKHTIPVKLVLNAPENVRFTTIVKGNEVNNQ